MGPWVAAAATAAVACEIARRQLRRSAVEPVVEVIPLQVSVPTRVASE